MHTNSSQRSLSPEQIRRRRQANMVAVAIIAVFCGIYLVSNHVTSLPSADVGSSTAAPAAEPPYAISNNQYRSMVIGLRLGEVKGYLGNPEDAQQHSYGNGVGGTSSSTCVYYNDLNGNTGVYQFCFTNGTLTSKAKY